MEDFLNKLMEGILWFIDLIKDLVASVSGKATAPQTSDEGAAD